ncbi:sensor histidine kinase [Cellulophaga baltica]|uniref:sensor histidine kinase n=1 Tax=Cellulophaga TaxID=104264 RepID=UPI001C0754FA|nr:MULTISPECIES: sensor histidine kinase [Cellulophaga]MBU2996978.1 sensor histidine kinase [Cellulophaga baltica]MDO6768376.1 sensor histidine kinase [Cellulophaga sp. 1_MG-2023]
MWRKFFKIFTLLYIPLLVLSIILGVVQKKEQYLNLEEIEKRGVAYKKNFLSDLCNSLIYSTQYWSNIEYPVGFNTSKNRSRFIGPYINFINGFTDYDQFRFIDVNGREFVRYERKRGGDMVRGMLQDKSDRDYVINGLKLKKGQIYLTSIDLNKENGVYERPYKPVLRGIAPIFDSTDKKIGVVVINFKMTRILSLLKSQISNSNFYLIDDDYNIITSNTTSLDLGYKLKNDSEEVLEKFSLNIEGFANHESSFIEKNSLWTFENFSLENTLSKLGGNLKSQPEVISSSNWIIVHEIYPKLLKKTLGHVYNEFVIFNCFAILTLAIIAFTFVKSREREGQFYVELQEKNNSLEKNKEQLQITNNKIKEINTRLKVRNNQLKEFNYLVCHNLRAPVTSMSIIVDMIKKEDNIDNVRTLLPKLIDVSTSVTVLTEDIREYVTILEQNEVVIESIELNDQIALIKNDFPETLLGDFNVILELEAWNVINFSKFYLKSVIQNLLSNAIKYKKDDVDSHIIFSTKIEDSRKVLYVKDNGRGIDLDRHGENMFKLYKRFHRNTSGKGMGLFLVKSQLEALNAQISVESIVGKGTTFKIKF